MNLITPKWSIGKRLPPCPNPYRLSTKNEWEAIQNLTKNSEDIFKKMHLIEAGTYDTERSDIWNQASSLYWSGETEVGKAFFLIFFAPN